jgi:predicted nucleic acid-binding protein
MKIIDASVALKWFVVEPVGQEEADQILSEIEQNPRVFAVPELFFAEMLHVLCRVLKDRRKVSEALDILENLGFARVGLGHELLDLAVSIAMEYKLSGYDAIYAATAQLTKGQWYTFDREAHKNIAKLNLSIAL